jgi:hypothetical protein
MTSRTTTWLALIAVLALTFWLYSQPELAIMLAEQLWACF